MNIRHLEQIFSIDKVVPVDLFPVFWADNITMLFIQVCSFMEAINFLVDPYY